MEIHRTQYFKSLIKTALKSQKLINPLAALALLVAIVAIASLCTGNGLPKHPGRTQMAKTTKKPPPGYLRNSLHPAGNERGPSVESGQLPKRQFSEEYKKSVGQMGDDGSVSTDGIFGPGTGPNETAPRHLGKSVESGQLPERQFSEEYKKSAGPMGDYGSVSTKDIFAPATGPNSSALGPTSSRIAGAAGGNAALAADRSKFRGEINTSAMGSTGRTTKLDSVTSDNGDCEIRLNQVYEQLRRSLPQSDVAGLESEQEEWKSIFGALPKESDRYREVLQGRTEDLLKKGQRLHSTPVQAAPPLAAKSGLAEFTNPAYHFSALIPTYIFSNAVTVSSTPSTSFSSQDGKTKLLLSAKKNPQKQRFSEVYRQWTAEHTKEDPGKVVDYKVYRGDWFVVSGTDGERGYYVKCVLRGEVLLFMCLEYNEADSALTNETLTAMSRAFTGN